MIWEFASWMKQNHSSSTFFISFITCRAKLLNADWLRQRAFFLNQEGMITWCWLAENACIKLASHFKQILKMNFRNASLLSLIITWSFHLNLKENQHATKHSRLVEKQGFFRPKTYWFAAWKQCEWGRLVLNEALDRTLWPPNWKLISLFCNKLPY